MKPLICACLLLAALAACAPRTGSGETPPLGPPKRRAVEVLLEERPADPAKLAALIAERRAAGAPQGELADLERLRALAEVFAAADGVTLRAASPEDAEKVRRLLRALSERIAAESVAALSAADALPLPSEETLVPAKERPRTAAERIADAAARGSQEDLLAIASEFSEPQWRELPVESLWQIGLALAADQRFADAAKHLNDNAAELDSRVPRAELWLSLGRWLLAAERYEEARAALQKVVDEYDRAAAHVREAEAILATLEEKQGEKSRRMMAKLVEAEAIVDYGSDLRRAAELSREVQREFPATDLSRRAEELSRKIAIRASSRLDAELGALWAKFEEGAPLERIEERLRWLEERTPADAAGERLAGARGAFVAAAAERKVKGLAARESQLGSWWDEAEKSEREARYDDALVLYNRLIDTPRREAALARIAAVVKALTRAERERAAELYARALTEKDEKVRLAALKEVEQRLSLLLARFTDFEDRPRVERDLQLVRAEIVRSEPSSAESASPVVEGEEELSEGAAPPTGEETGDDAAPKAPAVETP